MGKDIKIATLVISSNTYPALRNSVVQKKLFLENHFDNDLTFWYKAGSKYELKSKQFKLDRNDLLIDTDDGTLNMGMKTLLAFEWLEANRDYDFLVRPTPSSYINYQNLHAYIINNLSQEKYVYAGKVQSTNDKKGNPINFVSGSTVILNKASIQEILRSKTKWDHSYWDDVALSLLMSELNIESQNSDRFDVIGNPFNKPIATNFYQYRCRADNHYGYPRYLEATTLKIVDVISNGGKLKPLTKAYFIFIYKISKALYIYQFGWKVFEMVRKVLRMFLPKKIYKLIKIIFNKRIEKFKNIRFKF